jgi:hypothetical protein
MTMRPSYVKGKRRVEAAESRARQRLRERQEAERQARAAERAKRIANQRKGLTICEGTYAGGTRATAPKTAPYRDPALLEMARGRPCLLCQPGFCRCTPGTVVACHSNLSIHGKAKGRKADDLYTVWGGAEAHRALDQGKESREAKEARFMAAHLRQVEAWRVVAADPNEPRRFRRAAQRALENLNATPLGDLT